MLLDNIAYWTVLFVPCFFWGAYHYYMDRKRPEPVGLLILALVLGYGSAYIGLFLYECLDYFGLRYDAYVLAETSKLDLFYYALFVIGPIEELAKFIPFLFIIIHLRHFDEPMDGVIYASFIALGFSFHENQSYLAYLEGFEAVGRSIAAPMIHVLFASIWGYAFGYADIHKINRILATLIGLVLAMLLHGIFDFFSIGVSIWTNIVPPMIILIIWLLRLYMIKHPRAHLPLVRKDSP